MVLFFSSYNFAFAVHSNFAHDFGNMIMKTLLPMIMILRNFIVIL